MESTDRLQRRIHTLGELRTIVSTMKALSAVSLHQYEQAARAQADYYRTVELGLQVVLDNLEYPAPPAPRPGKAPRLAAILFGSDHGLCGRFNEDLVAYALQRMATVTASAEGRRLLAVGARAVASLEQSGQIVDEDFLVPGSAARITATVQQLLVKIDAWRCEEDLRYIYLFYNRHLPSGGYQPKAVQLFPLDLCRFQRLAATPWPSRRLPTFSMDRMQLLAKLLRQYIFVTLFRACAESLASEHASRLAAMQSAEKNLDERLEDVTTLFRRQRQEAITTELLEVVSGFQAVASGDQE